MVLVILLHSSHHQLPRSAVRRSSHDTAFACRHAEEGGIPVVHQEGEAVGGGSRMGRYVVIGLSCGNRFQTTKVRDFSEKPKYYGFFLVLHARHTTKVGQKTFVSRPTRLPIPSLHGIRFFEQDSPQRIYLKIFIEYHWEVAEQVE